jgi:hypothetical protein
MFTPEQAVRYLVRLGYDPIIFVSHAYRDYKGVWANKFREIAWSVSFSAAHFQIEYESRYKRERIFNGRQKGSSEIVRFVR